MKHVQPSVWIYSNFEEFEQDWKSLRKITKCYFCGTVYKSHGLATTAKKEE